MNQGKAENMQKKTQRRLNEEDVVFNYIKKYVSENGFAPSVREMCKACNLKSTATAFNVVNRLCEKGLLNKSNVKRRAIALPGKSVSVPLIGTVAAGQPIFATESYEGYYSIPENFFSGDDLFMLNVQGSSMIKIGIFDGDKVIVERRENAENGDIVVALVDDSATVKRFFKRDGKIILHPENDDMEDFIFDEVKILGKVVGLIRNF